MGRKRKSPKDSFFSSDVASASVDRLSNLPADVVCHILSFLPTKISVSTSVLSKRWSSLWAQVPNLDFESQELNILDIVARVMLRYKVENINTFRISYEAGHHDGDRTNFQLETCIAGAIMRNVKKLRVCFPVLPRGILTSKTIVDLCLRNCSVIPATGMVYLPALKRLHLDSVRYESDKSLEHLLSGCPVIEELVVCFPVMVVYYHITSPTLQKLTIIEGCGVKIDTPSLRFLKFEDCLPTFVSGRTIASLTEVEIGFVKYTGMLVHHLQIFVIRLRNVKCLKFSSALLFDYNDVHTFFINKKFHNLIKLEFGEDGNGDFLSYFLANADNLEVLIISKVTMGPHGESKCLSSHLRTIRIGVFGYTENEFELVRYLLWNAKVLRRMEIYSQHDGADLETKFKALKRISLFPRGSVACELAFR